MIKIKEKKNCAGCGACVSICPAQAIEYTYDDEGFNYPRVDMHKCIECNLCENICPWTSERFMDRQQPLGPIFYSAQLKDTKQLDMVSSGGAAWALATYIISLGGVVYGACQDQVDHIFHVRSETVEEITRIQKSKYLQSDIGNCYIKAKEDLDEGRKVLFTGTGCQIAGLKAYLINEYDNLITAEVVCHGVPSPLVWKSYRQENEEIQKAKMEDLVFRDKSAGWDNNQYKIVYSNGQVVKEDSSINPFHRGYLFGLYSRPSCGNCKFNLLPRVADFTFADYWNYNGKGLEKTRSLGVSLVAVNTLIAEEIINELKCILVIEETTMESALSSCRQMNHAPLQSKKRSKFWDQYRKQGFYSAWSIYIREKKWVLKAEFIKRLIWKIRRILKKVYDYIRKRL